MSYPNGMKGFSSTAYWKEVSLNNTIMIEPLNESFINAFCQLLPNTSVHAGLNGTYQGTFLSKLRTLHDNRDLFVFWLLCIAWALSIPTNLNQVSSSAC